MWRPDVFFALTGDVRRNSRALRQVRALVSLGYKIEACALAPAAETVWLEEGIRLRCFPQPQGGGPRFFYAVHRMFSEAARQTPAAIYHASDLYALPAMQSAARRNNGKLVYDARELYPFVSSTSGRPWIRLFWYLLERRFIRQADAVLTVSDSIAVRLAAMYGIQGPVVLYNVPQAVRIAPANGLRTHKAANKVLILHQGQIRKSRGCTLLLDAMRDIRGADLIFLGNGPLKPELLRMAAQHHLDDCVHFMNPVPPDELLSLTASADIGVTLLEDTCLNHRFALPNKLFEYLTAGLPVLASDLPEIRKVVAGFDVGCVVNPWNRQALVNTLQRMVDDAPARAHWSANAAAALASYSWEKTSRRFIQCYERLLPPANRLS